MTQKLGKNNGKKRGNTRKKAFKRKVNTQKIKNRRKGRISSNKRKQVGGMTPGGTSGGYAGQDQLYQLVPSPSGAGQQAEVVLYDTATGQPIVPPSGRDPAAAADQYAQVRRGNHRGGPRRAPQIPPQTPPKLTVLDKDIKKHLDTMGGKLQPDQGMTESIRTLLRDKVAKYGCPKNKPELKPLADRKKSHDYLKALAALKSFEEARTISGLIQKMNTEIKESIRKLDIKNKDSSAQLSDQTHFLRKNHEDMEYLMDIPLQKIKECSREITSLYNKRQSVSEKIAETIDAKIKKIIENYFKLNLNNFEYLDISDRYKKYNQLNLGEYIITPCDINKEYDRLFQLLKNIEKHSVLFSKNKEIIKVIVNKDLPETYFEGAEAFKPPFLVNESQGKSGQGGIKVGENAKLKFLFAFDKSEDLFNYMGPQNLNGRVGLLNTDYDAYIGIEKGLPIINDGNFVTHVLKILMGEKNIEIPADGLLELSSIPEVSLSIQCEGGKSLSGIFVVICALLIFVKDKGNRDRIKCENLINKLINSTELKYYFTRNIDDNQNLVIEDLGRIFLEYFANYLCNNIDGNGNLKIVPVDNKYANREAIQAYREDRDRASTGAGSMAQEDLEGFGPDQTERNPAVYEVFQGFEGLQQQQETGYKEFQSELDRQEVERKRKTELAGLEPGYAAVDPSYQVMRGYTAQSLQPGQEASPGTKELAYAALEPLPGGPVPVPIPQQAHVPYSELRFSGQGESGGRPETHVRLGASGQGTPGRGKSHGGRVPTPGGRGDRGGQSRQLIMRMGSAHEELGTPATPARSGEPRVLRADPRHQAKAASGHVTEELGGFGSEEQASGLSEVGV